MQSTLLPARGRVAPIVTLIVLAPIVSELLFGTTHLTILYPTFLLQLGVYGCGALIIRALVRHQRRGWPVILLLGITFAIAVECVILGTSLSPFFFGRDPNHIYSWAFGVNWTYLLFALGFESIWSIVLPIQLTELIFPTLRYDPWLGRRGLIIASIVFILASIAVWYRWTYIGAPQYSHGRVYQAPLLSIVIALVVIVALLAATLGTRPPSRPMQKTARRVLWPWLVGLVAFVLALLWFVLAVLAFIGPPSLPAVIPIVSGLAWAGAAFLLVKYWSASPAWRDAHRLALIFGALIASMLAGFLVSGIHLPIDLLGKLALNVIALLGLFFLAWRLRQRKTAQVAA